MSQTLSRPPIVAILGHVDHGKTTLLDFIRKSNLTVKEHGGITQKIGAYQISSGIKGYATDKITFIDTPGHEAFSKLRARGATVADIALLLIDAKDSIMPQTVESIAHIKEAKLPFIVVINKIDLPDANPEKIKNDLMKYSIQVEGKGGTVPVVLISAKTGKGVNELLETILLMATDLDLKYSSQNKPQAFIIETKKDRRGVVISAIIKEGSLKVGDSISAGKYQGKVRAMFDDLGKSIREAAFSVPFELLGFTELPDVGSVISNQRVTEETNKTTSEDKKNTIISQSIDLESLLHPKRTDKKLQLIIKADSQGSLEAIAQALSQNKNIETILSAVGDINKSDIFLAKNSQAIVIGFSVTVAPEARLTAKQEKVIIKTYDIIYHLLQELGEVAKLMQEKQQQEKSLKGSAKILATFIIEGEKVFGVKVTKGKLNQADSLEIYRSDKLIGKTKLVSLRIRAKTVSEVKKDQEAGMIFGPPLDIRIGDVVKSIL